MNLVEPLGKLQARPRNRTTTARLYTYFHMYTPFKIQKDILTLLTAGLYN